MVDDERCGLSPLTTFTIAADITVTMEDILSLNKRNRSAFRDSSSHENIIFLVRLKRGEFQVSFFLYLHIILS